MMPQIKKYSWFFNDYYIDNFASGKMKWKPSVGTNKVMYIMADKIATKEKKGKKKPFDVVEFGKRLYLVRYRLLDMNQTQFADALGMKQGMLSRLETGIGGNIHHVFLIVDYLNTNGYNGHMIFREKFDIELIRKIS